LSSTPFLLELNFVTLLRSESNCGKFIMKFEDILTDKRY